VIYIWNSMDPTDQENPLQDFRTAGTGIIWKERDDEWSSTLHKTGFAKISIPQGKKSKDQGLRWWSTGELKTSLTPTEHKLE